VDEQVKAQINLALAVCAHDGLISDMEISSLRSHFCGLDKITEAELDRLVDDFFEQDLSLEQLFAAVDDSDYALRISAEAASADGLDIRENFALERCYRFSAEKVSGGKTGA
jgi:hypothetical protein